MATTPNYQQYLAEAAGIYDPIYKGKEAEIGNEYENTLQQFSKNTAGEYGRRGMYDSSYYSDELLSGQKDIGIKKASALSDLSLRRQAAIEDLAGSRYKNAFNAWEAEQQAAAARQAASNRSYSSTRNYGAPKAAPKTVSNATSKAAITGYLVKDIQDNLKNWVASGRRDWYTEDTLIPSLVNTYSQYGVTPDQIKSYVYAIRKSNKIYGGDNIPTAYWAK